MGEAPKLTPAESRAVVRRALARIAGRVPVVVGVSNAELRALAALANDAMAAGAAGVMVAPAPGLAGDAEGAEDVFDVYLPLLRYEAQPGIGLAVRKELLFRRGALASPTVRAPGFTLAAEDHRELDRLVARLERRLKA